MGNTAPRKSDGPIVVPTTAAVDRFQVTFHIGRHWIMRLFYASNTSGTYDGLTTKMILTDDGCYYTLDRRHSPAVLVYAY